MSKVERILIVGGGIGGLATAIALRQAGLEVDLVEIQTHWKVYQTGIVIQANSLRAMASLGIIDEVIAAGYPYSGLSFQDLHGKEITAIRGERLAGEQYPSHLGLARPELHNVLTKAAGKHGANLRLGVTFSDIEDTPECAHVTFTDGTEADYDLVIGADGIYSKVRSAIFGEQFKPKFTGQGVWRYNVPRPERAKSSFYCVGFEAGKAGFIPLSQTTAYVWLTWNEEGNPWYEADTLADVFRSRMAPATGLMGEIRDEIVDSSQVVYRPLETILMPDPWYKGHVLLIGDAAHATTPHMGQGAAQAIEDGVVLGDIFQHHEMDRDAGLKQFMARRFERCKFIVESSLQIGEWELHPEQAGDAAGLTRKMLEVVASPI